MSRRDCEYRGASGGYVPRTIFMASLCRAGNRWGGGGVGQDPRINARVGVGIRSKNRQGRVGEGPKMDMTGACTA